MIFTAAAAFSDNYRQVPGKSLNALRRGCLVAIQGTYAHFIRCHVCMFSSQAHRDTENRITNYTMAGRKLMRRSTGSFILYSLLVKCQFKECNTAALSEHRVHMTFLYFLITLKVTRAIPVIIVRTCVCVCVCMYLERELLYLS